MCYIGCYLCPAMFKWIQRFSVGLRTQIQLNQSRSFSWFYLNQWSIALAVCLGLLSCWKVNLHPSLKFLEDDTATTESHCDDGVFHRIKAI